MVSHHTNTSGLLIALFLLMTPALGKASLNLHEFELSQLSDNRMVALSQYRGKYVYLDFWASWCPPCLKSLPKLNALQSTLGGDKFTVIGVNVDRHKEDAEALLKHIRLSYPNFYDPEGKIGIPLSVKNMPTAFLFDPTGRLLFRHEGFDEAYFEKLGQTITHLLKTEYKAKK